MKKYKIIYDDQDLLVVCKFAGLAVQSARVSTPDLMSLLRNEMLERGEKKPYLGLYIVGKAPRLRFVVSDVFHTQSCFLHDLTAHGLLKWDGGADPHHQRPGH